MRLGELSGCARREWKMKCWSQRGLGRDGEQPVYGTTLGGLADRTLSCRARLGKAYSKSVGWYGSLQGGASAFHLTYPECAGPRTPLCKPERS